jgi:signal transduction histidine kinase
MNSGIRLRLAALGFAVGLMGLLIVVVTLNSQQKAQEASAQLQQADSESFSIADHFRDKLRYANDQMRRYASTEEPAAWDDFLRAGQDLKDWIDQQAARYTAPQEEATLRRMDAAYQDYTQRAKDLHALVNSEAKKGASLAQYNGFFEQSRRFVDLGENLARAHYQSRSLLLAQVNRTLTELRLSVVVLLGFLFLFGLALALGVYRHLIAPMRVKLVESRALVERHEKLASLGLLAAGVAHEIRNPLTAIKTALFMQQKKLPLESQARLDAEIIEREILRLERIVTEILLFARPGPPSVSAVSADSLLREVEGLLVPELNKTAIQLIREESPVFRIKADPAQIKQVMINLVRNAAESIGRSGTITLRARLEKRRLRNGEADGVVLEVLDTGKGIPPEVQKRLGDPFFTTKEKGTGLGLAIAARLVAINGGALQYQTRPNRGSAFGVVLPQAEPEAEPGTMKPEGAGDGMATPRAKEVMSARPAPGPKD